MWSILAIVAIVFLCIAVAIGLLEATSGFIGDSSMVPGWLGLMILVLGVIAFIGFLSGQIEVKVH